MAIRDKQENSRPGRLRIVAGNWRSRRLDIADVAGLRPTSERIRETLFNWLTTRIHGTSCLDLFAGTGVLGLEALSRGARRAVFVERSAVAAATLRTNIEKLQAEGTEVRRMNALDFLQGEPTERFDLVFLDPPFAADSMNELLGLLDERRWLASGARIYTEQDRANPAPALPSGWQVLKDKTAGRVRYMLIAPGD